MQMRKLHTGDRYIIYGVDNTGTGGGSTVRHRPDSGGHREHFIQRRFCRRCLSVGHFSSRRSGCKANDLKF